MLQNCNYLLFSVKCGLQFFRVLEFWCLRDLHLAVMYRIRAESQQIPKILKIYLRPHWSSSKTEINEGKEPISGSFVKVANMKLLPKLEKLKKLMRGVEMREIKCKFQLWGSHLHHAIFTALVSSASPVESMGEHECKRRQLIDIAASHGLWVKRNKELMNHSRQMSLNYL